MTRTKIVSAIGFLAVICAVGLHAAAAGTDAEIRRVEQQMHDAYVKHDVALFASLYADDSTFTYSSGQVSGKEERVKRFTAPYSDLKDELQRIRVFGDIAIANDRSDYSDPKGQHVALQITRVWHKTGSQWQVVAFQATPIQQAK